VRPLNEEFERMSLFEQLLRLLPAEPGTIALIVASVGSLLGPGCGSAERDQSIHVNAGGGDIGRGHLEMRLPAWCGWSVDGMGPAVGGAVIPGRQRVCRSQTLGRNLAGAGPGRMDGPGHLDHRAAWRGLALAQAITPAGPSRDNLAKYGRHWPDHVKEYLPWCAGAAMACGIAAATAWPRIAMVILWSAAGVSLLVATGAAALSAVGSGNPAARAATRRSLQLAVLGGMVIRGRGVAVGDDPAFPVRRPQSILQR